MSDDLSDKIEEAANEPKSAASDGQSATNRDLRELIEADEYLAGKQAAKKRKLGIRFSKIIPPGGG